MLAMPIFMWQELIMVPGCEEFEDECCCLLVAHHCLNDREDVLMSAFVP